MCRSWRSPTVRMGSWTASWRRRGRWRKPATPSSSHRGARPWTSSATTQLAGPRSPRRYTASPVDETDWATMTDAFLPGRTATGRPHLADLVRRTLERPLASYQLILGTSGLLLGLGLIMVLSASSVWSQEQLASHDMFGVFKKQLAFAVLGLLGAYLAARMPLAALRRLVTPVLAIIVGLILATYTPLGMEINGNRNWLRLGPGLQVQPSEFAKLAVVLWIANLYARRPPGTPRQMILPMVPVTAAVAGLVVFQDDLGTALVLFAVIVGMLWVAGLPGRFMGIVLAGLGVVCIYFVATAPHRVARLLSFLNPSADPDTTGYQAIHAFMGFARGGFWGVGLGGSRQKWGSLPEAHTDFILAIIGEELGLFGSLVVLILFLLLAIAGFRIATRTKDPFARYAAAGIVTWIMAQATINIGRVLGLLP